MDIDSDDGDGFDPLLNSIMDAMDSIKEATADKIYQKIRKEGNTNFSKPQVDRALERALDYGIFEIHNNRYRIRDMNLDDEDTVYQKKSNKNREQTPYRSGDYNRGDLNPERDNKRYRSPSNEENEICSSCGRRKNPKEKCDQENGRDKAFSKMPASSVQNTKVAQSGRKEKNNSNKKNNSNDGNKRVLRKRTLSKEQNRKRKIRSSSSETERQKKLRKPSMSKRCLPARSTDSKTKKKTERVKNDFKTTKQKYLNQSKRNSKQTSTAYLRNKRPKNNKKKYSTRRRRYLSDEEKDEENPSTTTVRNSKSKEGKSESDISEGRSEEEKKDDDKNKREEPSTSKNVNAEEKNRNKGSGKEMKNLSKKESRVQESDWLDQPEPFHEGTVKQTNNSLTFQPMDSLSFRNPEDTSYFT